MAYKLLLTESAGSDLDGILAHLTGELCSPAAASELLELLLQRREVLDGIRAAVSDDHGRLALQQRTDELLDVRTGVLVICVGVDDYVGAQRQAGVYSCHESLGESAGVDEADDVEHAQFLGALYGAVGASVVDDEVFYLVDAVDVLRQVVDSHVKRFRFVVAGYLDNKLHCFLPLLLLQLPAYMVLLQDELHESYIPSFQNAGLRNNGYHFPLTLLLLLQHSHGIFQKSESHAPVPDITKSGTCRHIFQLTMPKFFRNIPQMYDG